MKKVRDAEEARAAEEGEQLAAFCATQDGVQGIIQGTVALGSKRASSSGGDGSSSSRRKVMDETSHDDKLRELQRISPWIAQFTPSAKASDIKEPPKRPPSPFSGRPLRSKDLMPVSLLQEGASSSSSSTSALSGAATVRFVCPVSLKTISSQPIVYLKNTGAYMLESVARELAYPTLTCPLTSKRFTMDNVLPLVQSASSFSSTGAVEASKFRHVGIN